MFDYIWGRVKSLLGANGVAHSEARHWHHRVYGGLVCIWINFWPHATRRSTALIYPGVSLYVQVDITTLLPSDLGAAAGYEALRLFNTHRTIYRQPLMDDREREEEALAGLAIAEGTEFRFRVSRPYGESPPLRAQPN